MRFYIAGTTRDYPQVAIALAVLMGVVAISGSTLIAQEFRGSITGSVIDQQGAAVPNATIVAKNMGTSLTVRTTTNEIGIYVAQLLPVGRYSVVASAPGFKTAMKPDLEVRGSDRIQVDFSMEVGAVSEEVTVTAQTELLDTATASKGQVIDSTKVANLPLLGRNPFMLSLVTSGVQLANARGSSSLRPFDNGGMDNLNINGSRGGTNEYLLDGSPNTNAERGKVNSLSFVPSPDATEEVKVVTNNYDAQYGRTAGGVISLTLKSGTNKLHGSLYHYFRNEKLNANDFASNLVGRDRFAVRWNQPGLEFDGPVYFPKLYDGRNRTFFMFSWEAIHSTSPGFGFHTVPTPDQRRGDFSRLRQPSGAPITLYDPLTTQQSGNSYRRDPFVDNFIPASRMDPVALKILEYIPLPNFPADARGANNYATPFFSSQRDDYNAYVIKIDQNVSERHRFSVRYVHNNRQQRGGDPTWPEPAQGPTFHWRINDGANFDLTSTLSPTLVLSSRFGFTRHEFGQGPYFKQEQQWDPTPLGFPPSLVAQLPAKSFPGIRITDYTSLAGAGGQGGGVGNRWDFSTNWSWFETLNKLVGAHSLKFGGEVRVMRDNPQLPTSSFGIFSFDRAFTQRDPLAADAGSGDAFASFLLGFPASGSVPYNVAPAYGNRFYVLFLHDDWRLSGKLTLNIGLRWDYESPMSERYNRQNRGFDATGDSPLKVPGLALKGGLLFTGPENRLPFERDLNNFQPRFGMAYQFRPTTVLRGGYGLFSFPTLATGNTNGLSVATPYIDSVDGGLTPFGRLSNPYPNGILQPPGSSQGLGTLLGQSFSYSYPQRMIPFVHQFSLGVQQKFFWGLVAEASFVGSRSRALAVSKGINEVSAEQLALGTALQSLAPNPFQGLLPGTAFNGPTVTRQQLLRPFPQFASITEDNRSIGTSWYNSLQVTVQKRLSAGFHFLMSYTLSKTMEAASYLNPQAKFDQLERVLANFDGTQRLVLSGGYELPSFSNSNGFTRAVLGGWQINAISTFQSGLPIAAPDAYPTGMNPKLSGDARTRDHWFNTCTLNVQGVRQNCLNASEPVAWIQRPPFTLRTMSTRFANVRAKRPGQVDFSVFKAFTIREGLLVQFRAESFNLLNTPWFGDPNTTLGAPLFGVVTPAQANDPRNMQLGLRLMF